MAKRYYRKKKYARKTLSNKNVYGNKSAKSQARQIAALRNRINTVYNRCKPEIMWKSDGTKAWTFSNRSEATGGYEYKIWGDASLDIGNGNNDQQGSGDFIRSVSLSYYIAGEYSDNIATLASNEGRGCVLRFIVVQRKYPIASANPPSIDEIVDGYVSSGQAYELNSVRSLTRGITEKFNVLCDRKFIFTQNKNQLAKRFRVKCPMNLRYAAGSSDYNRVYCIMLATGLRWDSTETYEAKVAIESKYVYTDN